MLVTTFNMIWKNAKHQNFEMQYVFVKFDFLEH